MLFFCGGLIFGQETRLELGDRYFDQFAYKKAIELYKGIGKKDWSIYAKLGDCYYNTSQWDKAIDNYRKALERRSNNMDRYRLRYAMSTFSTSVNCGLGIERIKNDLNSGPEKTLKVVAIYHGVLDPSDTLTDSIISSICDKIKNPEPNNVQIDTLSINTKYSDFGGYILNNTMYFSSSRKNPLKKNKYNKKLYKWNDQPYLDFYKASLSEDLDSIVWIHTDSSMVKINTAAHQAGITLIDSVTMYFSGGEVNEKGKLIYNRRGTSTLKLHKAILTNNKWVLQTDNDGLDKINLENYSVAGPAISPDGKKLFYVTCAPYADAKGQTDIYYVTLDKNGDVEGEPTNLSQVNTTGREMSPYISDDNILYFASDGIHSKEPAYGLLDIYQYDLKALNNASNTVKNLGKPFNSNKDDFAYFVKNLIGNDDYSDHGYFSSNREYVVLKNGDSIKSKGDDDIYSFMKNSPKDKIQTQIITGTATATTTGEVLVGATLELIDVEGMVLRSETIDSTGLYNFEVIRDETYWMRGSKEWYYDDSEKFVADRDEINIQLALQPYPCEFTVHHDFESDAIIDELDKDHLAPVFELLLTNPDFKIRIESHTDSRGDQAYNLRLSKQRAEAYKALLIEVGVNENQIVSTHGLGESQLLFSDREIAEVTHAEKEEMHAKNRRSSFKIIGCHED